MMSTLLCLHLSNRKEVGIVAFVFSKYHFFILRVFRNLIIKISHCTHNLKIAFSSEKPRGTA